MPPHHPKTCLQSRQTASENGFLQSSAAQRTLGYVSSEAHEKDICSKVSRDCTQVLTGFGLGLRAPHYDTVLEKRPRNVDWFEVISENFIDAHAGYRAFLRALRRDYPLILHGVSLSIGGMDPLNREYLHKLAALAHDIDAVHISDHLCWTGIDGFNTHDLLPLPYNDDTLRHVSIRIDQAQEILGRPLVLENPSTYITFNDSTLGEAEFLAQLVRRTGCLLLLDVNNIHVSCRNHGWDKAHYLNTLPGDAIAYIHLAGHRDYGSHIIDTHDRTVADDVWALYAQACRRFGQMPTMIEWDDAIPAWECLSAELEKAKTWARTAYAS